MSETEVRKAIAEYARDRINAEQSELVESVANELNVAENIVRGELEDLESNGFVYIVNGEVKVA